MSAELSPDGRGYVAMPIESPIALPDAASSGGSGCCAVYSSTRRATRDATSLSASGRMTANSSPPYRVGTS